MLTGFILLGFIILQSLIAVRLTSVGRERDALLTEDILLKVQKEIAIAKTVENGYSRTFSIPERLGQKTYNINITNNELKISVNGNDYSVQIETVQGNIQKGENSIQKRDENLYLN